MDSGLLHKLQELDEQLFLAVNHYGNVQLLNNLMLLLRNAVTWAPLYAFLLYWAYRKLDRRFIPFLVVSIAAFAVADFTSASILKPLFQRPRPCYNPSLASMINILTDCGGRFSMPSSHASNHFALGSFWFSAIYICTGKKWYWLWFWAFIVCYAQVYVGKHYPFDILVGALYGTCIGLLLARLFAFWIKRNGNPTNKTTTLA